MTNFEHFLKTIDPKTHKDILSTSLGVYKETGKAFNCTIGGMGCDKCIFGDDCSHCNGTEGARKWLDQEYTGPVTEEAITSGGISW